MNKNILQLPLILLLVFLGLLATSTKAEAKKDCNKLFPHPWQLPDRQRCHAENKPIELAEEAWGEAGRGIYTSAAAVMSKRSPTGVALDSPLKEALRPHFGNLVDRVTIHWGTPALDTWADARYGIRLSDTDSAGQAYGHDIYLAQQKPSSYSPSLVHLIAHELVHSEQYERYGSSLSNFGYHYFKKYKQAGQSYHNNQLEKEAEEKADRIYSEVYASLNAVAKFTSQGKYVDSMDIPIVKLGNPSNTEARFRAVNDWAARNGYAAAFPNFHQADYGQGVVYGTILLKEGVEWRDIPASQLGHPGNTEARFRAVNDWAARNGYAAAFPNFHQADYGQGVVYGTILIKK